MKWLVVRKLKEFGYTLEKRLSLRDVKDEQKEEMFLNHNEMLAIGFALISTMEGSRIIVMKILSMWGLPLFSL